MTEPRDRDEIRQLISTSQDIHRWLDEEDVPPFGELEQLQAKQQQLREQIDMIANKAMRTSESQALLQQCVQLDREALFKMTERKVWIGKQLHGIRDGNKAREAYLTSYAQTEGYFVDKHK